MRRSSSPRVRTKAGSVAVIAILIMALLSLVGTTLLMMSLTENTIASNDLSTEGAFHAAEAGLNVGLDQLGTDTVASTAAIPVTGIGPLCPPTLQPCYSYRSGKRTDAGPTTQTFVGTTQMAGYSLGLGTGYNNPTGYVFYVYQINATGTGPRGAVREIQSQAAYGPVPK
jgi:Tfp pilus assembly protein PilX